METLTHIPFTLDVQTLMATVHVEPGSDDAMAFTALVDAARTAANLKAAYRECFIDAKDDDAVIIGGVRFSSRTLRRNLSQAERVFAYVVTCGHELDEVALPPGDMLAAFWLDAIKVALLKVAMPFLNEHLTRRYRLARTASMSPGSGDADIWPLQQQRELFTLLGGVDEVTRQIGVELTDALLMVPNKTVSGIRFPTETDFRSCQVCHRPACPSRGAPFDKQLWDLIQHT